MAKTLLNTNAMNRSHQDHKNYIKSLDKKAIDFLTRKQLIQKHKNSVNFLIIAGTRTFFDSNIFFKTVSEWFEAHDPEYRYTTILTGMCDGADKMAELWSRGVPIPCEEYEAQWNTYGLAAGPMRNGIMASKATHMIAFWDNESTGTADMIDKATKWKLDSEIIYYKNYHKIEEMQLW